MSLDRSGVDNASNIIENSEDHFPFLQMLLDLSESVMHGQTESERHERVALFPSSSDCLICRCCPQSCCQWYTEGRD